MSIRPINESVGSATITFATDVVGGALTSTVAVHPTLAYRGRRANYTFAGVAAQHVTFDVSATSWVNGTLAGGAYLVLLNPSGVAVSQSGMGASPMA